MNITINDLQKADNFAILFQHIKLFSENININFEKGRMYLQSMDSSRVSIFEINIQSKWFDIYSHESPTNICIGINSVMLFKILNTRDKSQTINIIYTADADKLIVNFTSETKQIFDKHFEIPLMEIDVDLMEIPVMETAAEIVLSSVNFANIINQLKLFGETLEIECCEEKILLNSSSIDSGKMSVEIKIDDVDTYAINEGTNLKLSYSIGYLHNICMYSKIAKTIEIYLVENYPLKIVYNLDDSAKITYYLAPKISDDDE